MDYCCTFSWGLFFHDFNFNLKFRQFIKGSIFCCRKEVTLHWATSLSHVTSVPRKTSLCRHGEIRSNYSRFLNFSAPFTVRSYRNDFNIKKKLIKKTRNPCINFLMIFSVIIVDCAFSQELFFEDFSVNIY